MAPVLSLTQIDLEFGKKLTQALRSANFPFQGVFWLYDEERDDWQLIIATLLVDELGPRKTYLRLSETISQLDGTDFQRMRITVMSPEAPLYKAMRNVFGPAKSVEGARLRNTSVNGIVVPEAYLYEIH